MLHDVCALTDVPADGKKVVKAGGSSILLLRKGDEVFAVASSCPHLGLPLKPGNWNGERIKCLFHGSCFRVADGSREKKAWLMGSVGKEKLQTWPVTIEEGRVKVDL